jgi:hypothetical protein
MWALEWGITGAIVTYMPLHFREIGLSPEQLGQLMAVSAVGLWVAPFVVAQVCDRWMPTDKYLAVSHFVGGLTLFAIPAASELYRETGAIVAALIVLFGIFACAYFPTIPLASSLSFRHLPEPDVQFGRVRVWGTVGWVMAGLCLSLWLGEERVFTWLLANAPGWAPQLGAAQEIVDWIAPPNSSDCFILAGLLSFALSSFCVFLPATPPSHADRGRIAPLEILRMFREPVFAKLIAVSFLLALVVPFYSLEVPKMLEQFGYPGNWVPALMTIGQVSEFPVLLFLPFFLKRFGLKATFGIGMAAWLLRYALFAMPVSVGLTLTGIALHGICHVFIIVVIQLYVDRRCRSDLKASAQNLFALLTMGVAMPLGFLLAGKLSQWCIDEETGLTNYRTYFAAPAGFVLLLLLIFWRTVQLPSRITQSQLGGGENCDNASPLADGEA